MAFFGSFETDREIYSDPIYTVYGAKKSGDPTTEYAVKVFSVHHVGLEAESSTDLEPLLSEIERDRLRGIELQKKAAAISTNIAPVLESGRDDRGVWYVTRFYPRSVNKIISGRVALTVDALQHIIQSIAQGALDFKRACGRSHGEIRPSHIQLSKSERLSKANVVLSDPLPGTEQEAARYELGDLQAIGRVMLQLVLQRAIEREEDFLILPIVSSPEWTRLFGSSTERWLALCNRLLDPELSQQMSLEQLVAELESLRPKSGISPKLVMAGAAGVIVVAVIVVLVMRPRVQTIEISSDPPGATILVDKKEQPEKAPLKLKLNKGSYTIDAQQSALNLTEQSTNLVAAGGETVQLHFQFPYGSVAIKTEPPGATITADGKAVGKTPADGSPFVIPVLVPGTEVKYELSLSEHVSKTVRGVVTNGQRLALSETLPLSKDVGTIDMDSKPRGAKVFWKEKLLSSATPEEAQLEQGSYVLTAIYHDWPPKQMPVEVKRGAVVPVNFYFENGKVLLESDPPGASVWVGTNNIGETPMTASPWPAGTTTFRFEHTGFETTNETVMVADKGTVRVTRVLLTTNGVFEFSAEPAGAMILDSTGKEIGRTGPGQPLKVTMAPGTYSFGARIEGLSEIGVVPLKVEKREIKKHTFVFDYGSVLLDSVPSGAEVSMDGKALGVTPATFIQRPGTKISYRISAPDYLPTTNDVVLQSGDRNKSMIARLAPEPVSVALRSDPPGAQYFNGTAAVPGTESSYALPWGTNQVTAKYALFPGLGEVAQTLVVKKGAPNNYEFKFNYGTVILTNVPEEVKIKEAGKELASAPGTVRLAYERPGTHVYDLYDGAEKLETLTTNVEVGLGTILRPKDLGEIKNSIGMRLVKIHNLLGPGKDCWVGKFEVTQAEYQMVMGTNPSAPPVGENYPVENVSWDQAVEFCQKLRASDEKKPPVRGDYKLPTKEQWQFFAEGTDFKDAVIKASSTAPVGSKGPNPKHLYDVLGNVWEWLADSDGTNSQFIGAAYNIRFGPFLTFGTTDQRKRTFVGPDLGFRVMLVPAGATASAK